MHKFLFSILILIFAGKMLFSQDMSQIRAWQDSFALAKSDTSRINALRRIGNLYDGAVLDSAFYYRRKALALSEKINWTKGIAQNCLNLGVSFILSSQYDSAIYYETRALAAAKIVGDKNRIALIYINRSGAYTESEQYEKAMPDLQEALRIGEEIGSKDRQERAYQGFCELYMYQNNYDAALPWALKALQVAQEIGNEEFIGTAEKQLGNIYFEKKDYKNAEKLLVSAIPKSRAAQRPEIVIAAVITLGEIYNETHQYQKALDVVKGELNEAKEINEIDQVAELYYSMGHAYYNLKQYNNAKTSYQNGYEVVRGESGFQIKQQMNLRGMAETYSALNDFKNAYHYSMLASALNDSLTAKAQNEKLLKLQTEFETERKDKQIALLKKDQELRKTEVREQRAVKIGAFILSGLLIVIGFLMVNRYRIIQKTKRLVEIEKLRNNIARDLHDDIGSALSSININSKMALNKLSERELLQAQLEKIKENSGRMMEGMSDIVWAIHPENDSLEKMIFRMREFAVEVLEPLNIDFSFNNTIDKSQSGLDISHRKEIYLIFKEVINNAVKYSGCSKIKINMTSDKQALQLEVADNGNGFDRNQIKAGNGLRNIETRAKDMGASITISSETGEGTSVLLEVPIT